MRSRWPGRWAPALLWMAAIFAASGRPVPAAAGRVPDWISHGSAYAVLGGLVCRALSAASPAVTAAHAAGAVLLSTAYGVSDELHQAAVPGRHADPLDVAKDAGGAALGALAWRAARRPRPLAREPR